MGGLILIGTGLAMVIGAFRIAWQADVVPSDGDGAGTGDQPGSSNSPPAR